MSKEAQQFLTMHSLLSGLQLRSGAHVSRGGMPMHRNTEPKRFPMREGVVILTPGQLLSVRIPQVRIHHGSIEGYQKPFNASRARQIARWLEDNVDEYMRTLPAVEISIDGTYAYATDGQHRMGGGIIANLPIKAIVTKRNHDQARRLFALQGRAQRPSRNLLIFDSDGPFEEYLQDAVTSNNGEHAWSNLVSASTTGSGSKTRMSATAAFGMLRVYISGKMGQAGRDVGINIDRDEFDADAADQLALLMAAFGNRQTNPLAYSAIGLRAIAIAARAIFKSREPHPDDLARWIKRMPTFKFGDYVYIKSSSELADQMIRFWNRQLPDARKAARID